MYMSRLWVSMGSGKRRLDANMLVTRPKDTGGQ